MHKRKRAAKLLQVKSVHTRSAMTASPVKFGDLFVDDVLTHIFIISDSKDFLSFSLVCRHWSMIFRDHHFWKACFVQNYGSFVPKRLRVQLSSLYPDIDPLSAEAYPFYFEPLLLPRTRVGSSWIIKGVIPSEVHLRLRNCLSLRSSSLCACCCSCCCCVCVRV